MDTNKELENHILTEFQLHNSGPVILNETRGRIDNIDEIVKYFVKVVQSQAFKTYNNKGNTIFKIFNNKGKTTKTYNDIISINCFFNKYKITVTFEVSDKKNYNGGIQSNSIFQDVDGKWVCVPDINITVKSNNAIDALKTFSIAIGHELTHAYDLLQYALKTGQDPWYSIERNRYRKIKEGENTLTDNPQAIANMLYHLNRMERNAYIAQLRQELMNMKDKIKDNKSVFEVIKKTKTWEKFIALENNVFAVFNIQNIVLQNEIMQTLNYIMKKNFTTYNQVKNYFINRWNKWKKAYLTNASKIAYDVYAENNGDSWLDWAMMGADEINIKEE